MLKMLDSKKVTCSTFFEYCFDEIVFVWHEEVHEVGSHTTHSISSFVL